MYVSFSMTGRGFSNIHAQTYTFTDLHFVDFCMMIKRVCLSVYVSFSMTGRGFSNIHAQTYTLKNHHFLIFHDDLFERVCFIFDDRQGVFKHTYMLIR